MTNPTRRPRVSEKLCAELDTIFPHAKKFDEQLAAIMFRAATLKTSYELEKNKCDELYNDLMTADRFAAEQNDKIVEHAMKVAAVDSERQSAQSLLDMTRKDASTLSEQQKALLNENAKLKGQCFVCLAVSIVAVLAMVIL